MAKTKAEIIHLTNTWLNNTDFFQGDKELKVYEKYMEEHDYCYSFPWCIAAEEHLPARQKTLFVGAGRVLISKSGEIVDLEGSAPFVDFIKEFELRVQGLEEYWLLEIPFKKQQIGKLKTLLKWTTPELIKNVNKDSKIIFTENCKFSKRSLTLDEIAIDLKNADILYKLSLLHRKKQ